MLIYQRVICNFIGFDPHDENGRSCKAKPPAGSFFYHQSRLSDFRLLRYVLTYFLTFYPIGSMYGIYANIGDILMGSMLPYIAYMDPMGMYMNICIICTL